MHCPFGGMSHYHGRVKFSMPHKLFPTSKAALLLLAVVLTGCRQAPPPAEKPGSSGVSSAKTKTFWIRGKIVSVSATGVTLEGEAVTGFMEAMTMEYKLRDTSVLSELHPGDRITANILADPDGEDFTNVRLDNIVVIAQARPNYMPPVAYHVPKAGDAVPDFHLTNQSGKTIHLDQFKGKFLLVTFIYTRCPLADFCPRMSRNFAEIDKSLSADPAMYKQTHLLSISFDPKY